MSSRNEQKVKEKSFSFRTMNIRNVSIVVFYRGDGKILIQDRRNIDKDDIEWGFFGGGWEA